MKIEASELRYGNVFEYLIKDSLDERKEWYDTHYIDVYDIKECAEDNEVFNKFHKPIPLTEEILLKCGFEKKQHKIDIFEMGRIRIWIGSRGQFIAYLIEEDSTNAHFINSYQYLHQLQNLIHALTGKELEINL